MKRISLVLLLTPLAALLLAGCASYQRFDDVGVVSLNELYTKESLSLSVRDLPELEGTWVATNSQERFEPITVSRVSPLRPRKPEPVEVVTTLVIQANTNLAHRGLYAVTIESQADGKLEGRTAYLGYGVKLKGMLFLDLFPDVLEDSSFWEQAIRQHYIPTHWFLKVAVKGQTLEIGRINEAWLSTLLEKRPRSLGHASGIPEVLTDSPEAMQRFLQRHGRNPEAFILTTFHRSGGTP